MDLHSIQAYQQPQSLAELAPWQTGWAWLAGGTWLFAEPQPQVSTLIDISKLGWSELDMSDEGLTIGATCIMRDMLQAVYPPAWPGINALRAAVQELASFKIQNVATVGGNLCLAIAAGTFAPAMVLLGASYELITPHGDSRWVAAADFQIGIRQTILRPGELLRRIWIPQEILTWQVSYQRICVATAGLAITMALTAYSPVTGQVRMAVSAALPAPRLLTFDQVPSPAELDAQIAASMPLAEVLDDDLASAAYRYQVTQVLLQRSLQEATQVPAL